MGNTLKQFRTAAAEAIADPVLKSAFEGATHKFFYDRLTALDALPDVEALRDHLKAVRSATLARLAEHLETFEANAQAAGAHVHWARTADDANRIVTGIAQQHGVQLAVKSKSMASEEIHLNAALQAAGVEPVETDLGEWIIQLAGEPPSHIIVPAIHKTRGQVAELFNRETGEALDGDDIPGMTAVARRALREKFLAAGIGISGANLGVAETGSVVLVTNEGNGRMVSGAPPVHVAVMGIEKLAPNWDDAAAWLALLARSSTGQHLSVYTTVITGPRRPGDLDGPEEFHIVLLDNGRSRLIGTRYEEILQCIRCGACLNVCPVYRTSGGHAYRSPYSGPIGAVITPLLFGLEDYEALPHASSLCYACLDVCPVRIDIPRMLLALREDEVDEAIPAWWERVLERAVAAAFAQPRVYRWGAGAGRIFQRPLVRDGGLDLPNVVNPFGERRLPSLAKRSFRDMWESGEV
jgi:L-lactate dehydrogenase complex protein LldF